MKVYASSVFIMKFFFEKVFSRLKFKNGRYYERRTCIQVPVIANSVRRRICGSSVLVIAYYYNYYALVIRVIQLLRLISQSKWCWAAHANSNVTRIAF